MSMQTGCLLLLGWQFLLIGILRLGLGLVVTLLWLGGIRALLTALLVAPGRLGWRLVALLVGLIRLLRLILLLIRLLIGLLLVGLLLILLHRAQDARAKQTTHEGIV